MRVVADLDKEIVCHEHVSIRMRDGAHLAARIWLPKHAARHPVPAILEYIPYRKRDLTRRRDAINHVYFAAMGYACIRVDLRGSGESEGVLQDQYLAQEQDDGCDCIDWISKQAWCNGKVGMFGISWGGFAALQIAARRPEALHAIIAVCATDDLYVDNMHYMGGCLLSDNLSEASTMLAFNSCPPDPALVGDAWKDMWLERLRSSGLWLETWLAHQHRDDYWLPASVREHYDDIRCPALLVSGWADGFTNAIFRLLQHLPAPAKGLIGPWEHQYPHIAQPGPTIGFLQESKRWFDHWLKHVDNDVEYDPSLRVWLQDSMPPQTLYHERPGRWVAEEDWPSSRITDTAWYLGPAGGMEREQPPSDVRTIRSPLTVGLFAGKWCSYTQTPDLPADQRLEDGGSLVFETEPLSEDVEILGMPMLQVELSSDQPEAMLAARLSDVRPDGATTRITYGLLNLSHRDGHAHPQPLVPGKTERVLLSLNGVAQRFPRGHRIRLSLSTSYWPLAWPSPEPATLRIAIGPSCLMLPTRPADPNDAHLRPLPEAEGAAPEPRETLKSEHKDWLVHHDLASGRSTLEVIRDDGHFRLPAIDLTIEKQTLEWYSSSGNDPSTARGETRTLRHFYRGDWSARAESRTVLTCDADHFHLHAQLDAYDGEYRIHADTWNLRIPRRHV